MAVVPDLLPHTRLTCYLEIVRGMRDADDMKHGVMCVEGETAGDIMHNLSAENSGFTHLEHEKTYSQAFRDDDLIAAINADRSMFKMADGTKVPVTWQ